MSKSNIIAPTVELEALLSQLGGVHPDRLTPARLQLHWALQPVASVGFTLFEPGEDFEHTTVRFDAASASLQSQPTDRGLRAALGVHDGSFSLLDGDGRRLEHGVIAGETLDELYGLLATWLSAHGHDVEAMVRPEHDMPEHPVQGGKPFEAVDRVSARELGRWFGLGAQVVAAVAASDSRSTPVRMWPHHFDTATVLSLGGERSVGVGLSPGDASYAEPYVYVTPWPSPDASRLGALEGGGEWHTHGWIGAVLRCSVLLDSEADRRVDALDSFVQSALASSLELLDERA